MTGIFPFIDSKQDGITDLKKNAINNPGLLENVGIIIF